MKNKIILSLLAVSVVASVSAVSRAADEEKMYNQETKYACTGVGESKEDPKWNQYPLKLMFTGSGRAYVSDVAIKIQDSASKTVFEGTCDAPWLLIDLKPGKYQVTATAVQKYTKQTSVSVTSGKQNALAIRFPEISGE